MVRRALSHRRGTNPLTLDVDTASASASSTPAYVTIPIIVRTASTGRHAEVEQRDKYMQQQQQHGKE
ncbi:hypothetical protein NEMBOFW57_010635 [Staphylotrichum longicolle]|uniref:Uncharacterized protein n=1 Tax=Staphylotrichum longicolle TaxID=669026 RepID=A0AAD4END4_9PEZI|nr:hypothetical protein NEMBOFW57_010635 [Staphylotrichum longicolle]